MKKAAGCALRIGSCLLVVVSMTACGGKVQEKVAEQAIESAAARDGHHLDVDLSKGAMTLKTDNGETVHIAANAGDETVTVTTQEGTFQAVSGKAAKLPENFPKDVPVYPGAELLMVSTMSANETVHVNAKTADALDTVAAHYKNALPAQGWTEQNTMTQTGNTPMQLLNYTKGDRTLMVMLTTEDENTLLTITSGKE